MNNPSELWSRDRKRDRAFRPLENALEAGTVDAIYEPSKVFQHLQEATGKIKSVEDLSRCGPGLPDAPNQGVSAMEAGSTSGTDEPGSTGLLTIPGTASRT